MPRLHRRKKKAEPQKICDDADRIWTQLQYLKRQVTVLEKRYEVAFQRAYEAVTSEPVLVRKTDRTLKKLRAERAAGVVKLSTWKLLQLTK
jgi:hypothetical protein